MSMIFNSTNTFKPLNVCQKIGNIQELRNVSVAPPDQLQPVTEHMAKQIGRQAMPSALGASHSDRDNSGAGYIPHKQPILGKGSAAFFWRGSR